LDNFEGDITHTQNYFGKEVVILCLSVKSERRKRLKNVFIFVADIAENVLDYLTKATASLAPSLTKR